MNRSIIFGPFSALILTCVFGFRLLHMSRSKFGPTHKLIFDQVKKKKKNNLKAFNKLFCYLKMLFKFFLE